jgi:ribosomal protein S18 acetylase RimI-like enzyme
VPEHRHAIRSATLVDIPGVVDLWNRAAGPTRHAGRAREAQRLVQRDPDALLVAEHDGRIIATLIVGWDGWRCHMYRLATEPEARRSGVARALVGEARARAVALGALRLDAMVNTENATAIAFWENAGFQRDPEDQRWSLLL